MKNLLSICMLILSIFAAGCGKKGTVSPVKVENIDCIDSVKLIKVDGNMVFCEIGCIMTIPESYSEADGELIMAIDALGEFASFLETSLEATESPEGSTMKSTASFTAHNLLINTQSITSSNDDDEMQESTITISERSTGKNIAKLAMNEQNGKSNCNLSCKCESLEEFYSLLKSNGLDLRPVKREIDKNGVSAMTFTLKCNKKQMNKPTDEGK